MSTTNGPAVEQATDADPSLSPSGKVAGWPQIAVLLAGSCMPVLGSTLLIPVVHTIQEAFASDPAAPQLAPLVQAAPALMIGLLAPFAGQIVDRLGRLRLLMVAMVAYTIFGTAPLWLPDLRQILVSRVLLGVAEAAVMTVCLTLISDYFTGERRAKVIGLQTGTAALAATVFVAVGGTLGGQGWRTPFAVYGLALLIAVPMAILLWEPKRAESTGEQKMPPTPWRKLRTPLAVTVIGALMFNLLPIGLSYFVTREQATAIGTIGNIAIMIAAYSFSRLGRFGIRLLLPVAFGLGGLGLLITGASGSPVVVGVGFVVTCTAAGLILPTLLNWATSGLTAAERGRGTGVWTGTFFLSQFICGALVSAANSTPGGLGKLVVTLAAVCLVMMVGTFIGTRPPGRTAPAGS